MVVVVALKFLSSTVTAPPEPFETVFDNMPGDVRTVPAFMRTNERPLISCPAAVGFASVFVISILRTQAVLQPLRKKATLPDSGPSESLAPEGML